MSERRRNFAGNVCLAVSLAVWLALIIPGHALRVMVHPTGELPLWYEISTCANASDAVTVSGYGGEPASTSLATEAYTRSYWIQHGRIPSPYEFAGSACPIVAREPGPFDITLEKDDGYRESASYGPNILVATGSYLLLSISVSDSAGNVLLPTTNLELGPTEAFPWRLNGMPVALPGPEFSDHPIQPHAQFQPQPQAQHPTPAANPTQTQPKPQAVAQPRTQAVAPRRHGGAP